MDNRQAYEKAANMSLENSFFDYCGIDPNAEYERNRIDKIVVGAIAVCLEIDEYLSSNKLNSVGSGSILHQRVQEALKHE
jgi:hypothetical protein